LILFWAYYLTSLGAGEVGADILPKLASG